jgi:phosphatidylserine/phosphatidylglycerophosphate/cardiolipin synthase-like enzyme
MTIGSDNLNRRSWTHDSEVSCAVLDSTRDDREPLDPAGLGDGARRLARDMRLELWREHLQCEVISADPLIGFEVLRRSADADDAWRTSGRVGPRPPGRLRHHRPQRVAALARPLVEAIYRLVNDPDGRPIGMRVRRSY